MKSVLCAAAICLWMLIPPPAAHSSVLLVSDSPGPAYAETSTRVSAFGTQADLQPLSPEVLRQRVVRLNPDKLLYRSNVESIKLQLFDNIDLTAVQEEKVKEPNGFLMWTGAIEGAKRGQIVLVVRNGLIFASVYLQKSIIQIRPVDAEAGDASQIYVIRELACPWRSGGMSRGTGSASNARRMIELVNLEREADGLPALEYDSQLTEAARRHTMDMALHDTISHELSDGERFYQNVFASGYPVCAVGENLAAGLATPEEAFECLLSSPDHRANILNSEFTQIGVSEAVNRASGYGWFWAQEFGSASPNSEQTVRFSANSPRT